MLGPWAMLSSIDFGKGLGFWNTMPTVARSCTMSADRSQMFCPPSRMSASIRQMPMVSFMRLSTTIFGALM